jgi:hypothetical protein
MLTPPGTGPCALGALLWKRSRRCASVAAAEGETPAPPDASTRNGLGGSGPRTAEDAAPRCGRLAHEGWTLYHRLGAPWPPPVTPPPPGGLRLPGRGHQHTTGPGVPAVRPPLRRWDAVGGLPAHCGSSECGERPVQIGDHVPELSLAWMRWLVELSRYGHRLALSISGTFYR